MLISNSCPYAPVVILFVMSSDCLDTLFMLCLCQAICSAFRAREHEGALQQRPQHVLWSAEHPNHMQELGLLPSSGEKKSMTAAIVGGVVGGLVLLAVAATLGFYFRRGRMRTKERLRTEVFFSGLFLCAVSCLLPSLAPRQMLSSGLCARVPACCSSRVS
jgi:hypothetical protein